MKLLSTQDYKLVSGGAIAYAETGEILLSNEQLLVTSLCGGTAGSLAATLVVPAVPVTSAVIGGFLVGACAMPGYLMVGFHLGECSGIFKAYHEWHENRMVNN